MSTSGPPTDASDDAEGLAPSGASSPPSTPSWVPRSADGSGPSSVSSLALERLGADGAVARRTGSRAEAATLRAQLRQANLRQDIESERVLAAKLARLLVRRGTCLAEATKLARRSLLLGEDPELREELSAWFAGIGELSLAAGTLEALTDRPLAPHQLAALWLRVAVLRARAGDARAAMQALRAAFEAQPDNPLPLELLAALRGWAKPLVTAQRAAQALVEAAKRRRARGDERGALEDLLRALEADPSSSGVAERLGQYLAEQGRPHAADEVFRGAAKAAGHTPASTAKRVLEALGAGDPALALSATVDARADTTLERDKLWTAASIVEGGAGQVPVPNFDGLLSPLGLQLWLAARLLWLGESQSGEERAHSFVAAARLWFEAAPELAGELILDALDAHPRSAEALLLLSRLTERRHHAHWAYEAALRAVRGEQASSAEPLLVLVVEAARCGDLTESAGAWALAQLRRSNPDSPVLVSDERRFEPPPDSTRAPLGNLERLSLAELKRSLGSLAERPELAGAYAEALLELQRRELHDEAQLCALQRVLGRLGRFDELERLWRLEVTRDTPRLGAALGLMRLYVRKGAPEKALQLLEERPSRLSPVEVSALAALASLHGGAGQRAAGFELLAQVVPPNVRSVLYCFASETALEAGEREAAFRLAELACQANPKAARPVICCAAAVSDEQPRLAALALERACEVSVPRAAYCQRLVAVCDRNNDADRARRWAQRWLSLCPLDPQAGEVMLQRWASSDNAALLAKGLDWWLSQPRPRELLAPQFGRALSRLAELDAERCRPLLRRVLGAFGVLEASLTRTLGELSHGLDEPALRIAILERRLAVDLDANVADNLLELAELHTRVGDPDAAYDALSRALSAGALPATVGLRLANVPLPGTSDGELLRLLCRVRVEGEGAEPARQSELLRELGATYWDLAGDRDNAISAWVRAAELDPEFGDERLAQDLIAFCGYTDLVTTLQTTAQKRSADRAGSLLLAGARVALRDGFTSEAASLAAAALDKHPLLTEALAVLERAVSEAELELLSRAYTAVNGAALGVYGERALHYRAARQYERRRLPELALQHAIEAFEAVPAEGVAYVLMLRLASQLGREGSAALALRRVAEVSAQPQQRAHWLELALRAAGPGIEGLRLKADVLLRALAVRPEPDQLLQLGQTLQAVLRAEPERRESYGREFDSAVRAVLRSLDEPADAALALTAARTASEVFASAPLCAAALDRAIQLDVGSTAFSEVRDLGALLSSRASAARRVLESLSAAQRQGREPQPQLLDLACALAEAHAPAELADWVVARALCEPPRAEWVAEAHRMVQGRPDLAARLAESVPRQERLRRFWERVSRLERSSADEALELLENHRDASWLQPEDVQQIWQRRLALCRREGRFEQLERLLKQGIDSAFDHPERRAWAIELCRLLARRSAHAAALDVLALAATWAPLDLHELQLGAEVARTSGDRERELVFLEAQQPLHTTDSQRLAVWQRLWQLHEELGQTRAAVHDAERILELDPSATTAHAYLVAEAERQQDPGRLAELLAGRLRVDGDRDQYLRLAELFHQALAQPVRAVEVLQMGLEAHGADARLLERLAVYQQAAQNTREAALSLERAAALLDAPEQRADFTARAARLYFEVGAPEKARALLDGLPEHDTSESVASLRVRLARSSGSMAALGEALERAATLSTFKAGDRAQQLVEAAELALAQGDLALALQRARAAAKLAPRVAAAQLLARRLEYLQRGAGSSADALATIGELRGLGEQSDPEAAALQSFLLAEALDQRVGLGAGLRELQEYCRRHEPTPLVALGLAERFAAQGHADLALPHFQRALDGASQLHGLRSLSELRQRAHEAALQAGDETLMAQWSDVASRQEGAAGAAPLTERSVTSAAQLGAKSVSFAADAVGVEPQGAEPRDDHTAPASETATAASETATAASETATAASETATAASETAGTSELEPQLPAATPRPRMSTDPGLGALSLDAVGSTPPAASQAPSSEAGPTSSAVRSRAVEPAASSPDTAEALGPPDSAEPAAAAAVSVSPPSALDGAESFEETRPSLFAPESPRAEPTSDPMDSEAGLLGALRQGQVAAGEQLLERWGTSPDRVHDRVNVLRQIVAHRPGDLSEVERLLLAVVQSKDTVYASALRHALLALSNRERAPTPPPLNHQAMQPDGLLTLLMGNPEPVLEVLASLWHAVPHLLRVPEPPPLGARRLTADTSTPLGQLTATLARLLGAGGVHVYHQQGPRPVQLRLVLEQPLRLIVTGPDLSDMPEFRFHFGSMLLATRPEYALIYGLAESDVREVLKAVLAAFGPPGRVKAPAAEVVAYAERLWESVPVRVQRRLQELTSQPELIDYDRAFAATNTALWKAGLFATGDLSVAVAQVLLQEGIEAARLSVASLQSLCQDNDRLAALLRFATSVEYSEARWRPLRSLSSAGRRGA